MLIDLRDPTPLTATDGLLMLLNAHDHVFYDKALPRPIWGLTIMELRSAAYRIRRSELNPMERKELR